MSKVYSFRLSENNPREAQVRAVIEAWVNEGYSLRQVIVEALDCLSKRNDNEEDIRKILKYIENMYSRSINNQISQGKISECADLPKPFMMAVKKSAKLGISIN